METCQLLQFCSSPVPPPEQVRLESDPRFPMKIRSDKWCLMVYEYSRLLHGKKYESVDEMKKRYSLYFCCSSY
ncbi:hypothetical protein L1987_32046 [Smallanthus sonchifolius]|uniref:Uncharacterized protein n=1 Tax=Smallanthus sonchifolius TaxID=185202 RepID=A0ACB9I7W5_9ASTR|nr:hypothetical protein L1987_32046 [Smallanthus sonchifolius]